jgi:hypothetical protein
MLLVNMSSGSGIIIYFPLEYNTPKFLFINAPLFFLFFNKFYEFKLWIIL